MRSPRLILAALLGWCCLQVPAPAADLKVLLPLGRSAYQTNEWIDLSVVRGAGADLAAGDLVLTLQGEDGSRLSYTFAVPRVAADKVKAAAVEHLHVNGWLLRPGHYTAEVRCDDATAKVPLDVYNAVRRSSFRLVNWGGRAAALDRQCEGEDNLGYNLFLGQQEDDPNLIVAGVDYMRNCTMSGAHQMDLRMECDWSDPYVIRGGTRRVVRQAFLDRTLPNAVGVHFYDEPGLTWHKDPATGENTPHGIPSQLRSFEGAFGQAPIDYRKVDPKDPADVARWAHWARWKLGFMDAAWQDAQFGVSYVRPDYVSVTQSQYGYTAFTDGYYFNVVRSLPVISGHGGYHDFGPGYFNPSAFLEFARARDFDRPNWYLPTWYGNTTADEFRLEQYLSFQTNIQGLMSPPELDPFQPEKVAASQGVVESNHLAGRLGTIFNTMPVTRPPVALLYSLSDVIHAQTQDRNRNYAHEMAHGRRSVFSYLAGKLLQQQFMVVLDEDIVDGTLAAHHKALVLTAIDYLDPQVEAGIEAFIKQGGLVLMTGDCTVKVPGAVNLGVVPEFPDADKIAELVKAKNYTEAGKYTDLRHYLGVARKLADAIRPHLEKAGLKPVLASSEPGIAVTRQAAGDIEYLFAVNATHDPEGNPQVGMKATTATLGFAGDGPPVYDAIHGGPVPELTAKGDKLQGQFRFGPGQMRVFARTARPIGGVKAGTPLVRRDYTAPAAPLRLDLSASLLDSHGGLLCGSAPLRIRVLDPQGAVRYHLYRATDRGTLRLNLPLAINDPAGAWTVEVTELLNNTTDTAPFTLEAVTTCGASAGATHRAVFLADDRGHVFRFFRTHQAVTIVKGAGADDSAVAERLVKDLKPWDVPCTVVNAADVNKPRKLTAEEAATWIGLDPARATPDDKNSVSVAGFAVRGPVILLGTPEDNPLLKFLGEKGFLPYKPTAADMPGPGRGLVAWQLDALGNNQESIALIGYDGRGLNEAAGTLFEMVAGLEPLTPLQLPRASTIAAPKNVQPAPELARDWSDVLPDRITGIKVDGAKLTVLTHAGVLADVGADGKVTGQRILDGAAYHKASEEYRPQADPAALAAAQKKAGPERRVKWVAANERLTVVVYWGGTVHVYDQGGVLKGTYRSPQDVTALAWSGQHLLLGDADGRLTALTVK